MLIRGTRAVIPYPFQLIRRIFGSWKSIGYRIFLREPEARGLPTFVFYGHRHIQLQGIVGGIKNMYAHIAKRATTIIHYLSPVSGMVISFLIGPFRSGSQP